METQTDLNKKILIATQKIQEAYPDLNRYLDEMPEYNATITHSGVNTVDLREYLDSLNNILLSSEKAD